MIAQRWTIETATTVELLRIAKYPHITPEFRHRVLAELHARELRHG